MLAVDIPDFAHLTDLMDARDDASVTIVLPSSPIPTDHARVRADLRSAIDTVGRELEGAEVEPDARAAVRERLDALDDDEEFWTRQSRSLVVLASPGRLETFRLANTLERSVTVGDRFDTGALLRAVAFPHRAFAVRVAPGHIRLDEIGADHGVVPHPLDLPDDLHTVLEKIDNHGQADMPRAQGSTGDRIERERFCRIIEEQVTGIVPDDVPLILSASTDFDPAYRAVNTHPLLLDAGIAAHPESLDDGALEQAVRGILDEHYAAELAQWREDFGTLRAEGLATSSLADVAAAAAAAGVEELLFDIDADREGTIDEFGRITEAGEPGAGTYALVDEIAARVLRSGGRVRAVRNADLLDASPVAARLRFPVPTIEG